MKNKVKTYCFSVILITLVLSALRCASLFFSYDAQLGYFDASFLTSVQKIIYVLGALWCVSTLFLIPKGEIDAGSASKGVLNKTSAAICGVLLLLSSVLLALTESSAKLGTIFAVCTVWSALYFILLLVNSSSINTLKAFLSILPIISTALLLAVIYFNMSIAMNSPHKILASFTLMSATVFALCETRVYLSAEKARLHLATALLTFMLGASFVISGAVFIIFEKPTYFSATPLLLGNIANLIFIFGISLYAVFRSFSFASSQKEENKPEIEGNCQKESINRGE